MAEVADSTPSCSNTGHAAGRQTIKCAELNSPTPKRGHGSDWRATLADGSKRRRARRKAPPRQQGGRRRGPTSWRKKHRSATGENSGEGQASSAPADARDAGERSEARYSTERRSRANAPTVWLAQNR
eukprot:548017-Alexandrium_andersonii.AAC.1